MSTTPIEWRPVHGWPAYEVSSQGAIRNSAGQEIKLQPRDGYLCFAPKRGKRLSAHVAVLEAFVCPRPADQQARHLDGNRQHNAVGNLAWGTRLENAADKLRHATQPRGERAGTAKLTETDVREIRVAVSAGTRSLRSLAKQYGVSHTAVRRAATGIKWSHLQ